MKWLDKISKLWFEVLAGALVITIIFGLGYMASNHKNSIEKRYGFCTMTPDLKWYPCHIEPLMIRCIEPGGAFDHAGFKDKDIIYLPQIHSEMGFHKLLKKTKGTAIEFYVIPFDSFNTDCESENRGKRVKKIVVAP